MDDGHAGAEEMAPGDAADNDGSGAPPAVDRVLTLPNAVTLVRLCCLPVFVWLLFSRDNRAAAAWLLGVLGMTDWVDGYLARRLGQTSNLGKAFDPAVDRILFIVGGVAILVDGSVAPWFVGLVLAREVVVGTGVLLAMALGAARPDVTFVGKTGAFLLMVAFPCFLGAESTLSYAGFLEVVAWGTGLPGLVISFYSAALYVPIYRNALAEGRSARGVAP